MAYSIRTGQILFDAVRSDAEGFTYRITDLGARGRPVKKMSLRYASCAIESGQYVPIRATNAPIPVTSTTPTTSTLQTTQTNTTPVPPQQAWSFYNFFSGVSRRHHIHHYRNKN